MAGLELCTGLGICMLFNMIFREVIIPGCRPTSTVAVRLQPATAEPESSNN